MSVKVTKVNLRLLNPEQSLGFSAVGLFSTASLCLNKSVHCL